ncbi:hypothetical protein V5O48_016079 [Marasmius crinis-equi]|uniref:Uncharacterized protein n=1 Tax=Marasmius crinis-equi TaxID=585013 RepID=A0ABR3ESR9_9AGAR
MTPPLSASPSPNIQTSFTVEEIREIAITTTRLIDAAGYRCYLFGSAACYFYCYENHTPRIPGDFDFVVSQGAEDSQVPVDAEALKKEIEERDGRFYRVKARTPGANYCPLWFSFSSPPDLTRSIKIYLVPSGVDGSTLRVPHIPTNRLRPINIDSTSPNLSLIPFIPLLIMKPKGWHDHRVSRKPYMRRKLPKDVEDVSMLIIEAVRHRQTVSATQSYFPAWFIGRGKKDARWFLRKNPEVGDGYVKLRRWEDVGLVQPAEPRGEELPWIFQQPLVLNSGVAFSAQG